MSRTLARWGRANPDTTALVVRLDPTGAVTVAGFRSDVPRMPASTMKLVTSAAALMQLGPRFRFQTRLLAGPGTVIGAPVVTGPLYLRGSGDPVLATRPYARRHLDGRATDLTRLALTLKRAGIRHLRGPLVADEGLFDRRRRVPGWPARYFGESSPLSALVTNRNFAGETEARYVSSPPVAAAQRLRAALRRSGVRHGGRIVTGSTPEGATAVAVTTSPPLATIVRAMNLASDNFVAETLTKDVGAYGAGRGSTASGTARAGELLAHVAGMTPGDRLADGSGLSRDNRLAAGTLVRLLAAADADPTWGAALIASLAQGGEGTLIRRFRTEPARTRVRAKTGYIDGVSALAGRVVSINGRRYAFALLMNSRDIQGARAVQDRTVKLLASGAEDPPAVR